jgi:hypothetical protein
LELLPAGSWWAPRQGYNWSRKTWWIFVVQNLPQIFHKTSRDTFCFCFYVFFVFCFCECSHSHNMLSHGRGTLPCATSPPATHNSEPRSRLPPCTKNWLQSDVPSGNLT